MRSKLRGINLPIATSDVVRHRDERNVLVLPHTNPVRLILKLCVRRISTSNAGTRELHTTRMHDEPAPIYEVRVAGQGVAGHLKALRAETALDRLAVQVRRAHPDCAGPEQISRIDRAVRGPCPRRAAVINDHPPPLE